MIPYGATEPFQSGVPLGGLGCGKIELCADGAFRNLTTHNNIDQPFSAVINASPRETRLSNDYTPEGLRSAFFFAAAEGAGARVLKYSESGHLDTLNEGSIDYLGRYPQAILSAEPFAGISVSVEAFSPLIPTTGDTRDSALPAAAFRMRAENTGQQAQKVCLGFSWPNIIGCGGYPRASIADLRDNRTDFVPTSEYPYGVQVRYSHAFPKVDRRLNGEWALMLAGRAYLDVSWMIGSWNAGLWAFLIDHLSLGNTRGGEGLGEAGAIAPGNTGAVAASFALKPGEIREVPVVLAWYFPDRPANQKPGIVNRNFYAKQFGSAQEVGQYLLDNLERLHSDTISWQERLTNSSLPGWFSHKLINNLFPLSSCSLYFDDGRFGINEAPSDMNGCMGTIDQRAASATAYVMLFPQIAKSELRQFAEQQISADHEMRHGEHWDCAKGVFGKPLDRVGAIKHEIGWDELEEGKYGGKLWCNLHWPDLSCVFVLQCYQQIIWTGDTDFLHSVYPKIKDALAFHKRLDQNSDGLADLWGPGSSTFDNEQFPYYGASTFVATLYLAALKATMRLAEHKGDAAYMDALQRDFEQAQATVERDLWRADLGYYLCWHDRQASNWQGTAREHAESSENSMLSHLAGVWLAKMLDLGEILDEGKVQRSLRSLYKRHVAPFPYCPPNEVRPDGSHSISWPYYGEAYFAANAIHHGMVEEGMEMVRKFYHTAFEKYTTPWDSPLSYEGADNSIPWWGRWYMTNPSSWTILQALTGCSYDALTQALTLYPRKFREMPELREVPVFMPCFRGRLSATETGILLALDTVDDPAGLPVREIRTLGLIESILLNGTVCQPSLTLKSGDLIEIEIASS